MQTGLNSIPIIHQDADIIVVNKPAGLSVHKKSSRDQQETLADILVSAFPEITNVGVDPLRPGIVHRLDKYTSGVMLVARNQPTWEWLTKQFQERKVEKEYTALVAGSPKENRGAIDSPIGSLGLKKTARRIAKSKTNVWREAHTEWRVIKRYENYTLLKVLPKTGRTHQIRVHLASVGHPIVCDHLYGGKKVPCPTGLARFFLHASCIRFSLPPSQRVEFCADLPRDLSKTLETLK